MKFKYYTNAEYGTDRIFMENEKIEMSPEIWKFEGLFTIDQLPINVFPIQVNQNLHFYDILEVLKKYVKVKSTDDNFTFFVPKSKLFFNNGKFNITYWYYQAKSLLYCSEDDI